MSILSLISHWQNVTTLYSLHVRMIKSSKYTLSHYYLAIMCPLLCTHMCVCGGGSVHMSFTKPVYETTCRGQGSTRAVEFIFWDQVLIHDLGLLDYTFFIRLTSIWLNRLDYMFMGSTCFRLWSPVWQYVAFPAFSYRYWEWNSSSSTLY